MAENKSIQNEISRIKELMNYGSKTENKHLIQNSLEHANRGADGKTYGIVREGNKYYIKYIPKSGVSVLAENFEYIGGITEKKRYMYDSFGMALKQFDLKMKELRESYCPNAQPMLIESLDPRRKEYVIAEGTEEMRKEIARQRQIMLNAQIIQEGKYSGSCKNGCGDATKKGAPFGSKEKDKGYTEADENPYNKDGEPKKMNEGEVLAWNDNPDYMDKSKGTEIGDGAPFDKCPKSETKTDMEHGTTNESCQKEEDEKEDIKEEMKEPAPNEVNNWDKGLPSEAGTGDVKTEDGAPFNKKVNESIFETDDELDSATNDLGSDAPIDDVATQDLDTELDNSVEDEGEDFESMLQQILTKLDSLEAKVTDSQFGDDELYDDGTEGSIEGNEADSDVAPELGDDMGTPEDNLDDMHEERQLKEEKTELDDFGKHPAYQKEPFEYPNPNHQEKEGYHDWNDDSVEGAKPYGQSIGDGSPFNQDVEVADNSIAESKDSGLAYKIIEEAITRFFGKKQK